MKVVVGCWPIIVWLCWFWFVMLALLILLRFVLFVDYNHAIKREHVAKTQSRGEFYICSTLCFVPFVFV